METAREEWEPLLLCFVCDNAHYSPDELASFLPSGKGYRLRFVTMNCGRMDPLYVLRAFQRGADAVLIAGCAQETCHEPGGALLATRRHQVMQRLLRFMGLEEERYCVFRPVPGQPGRLSDVISEVMDRLERLGPNRKFREEL